MKIEDVKYIIIHCTKTPPDSGIDDVALEHRREGRLGCGYHYVVKQDGTVQIGRSPVEAGCHAKGFNDCSIGVALVGGRDKKGAAVNNFTPPQIASLHCLCNTLSLIYKTAKVVRHSDLDKGVSQCPPMRVKLKDQKE